MHLVGQLIGDHLVEKRGQKEVLHRIECRRLVEAAFVVVLLPEDVLGAARWRDGQRLWGRGLVDVWSDRDPSLVGLVDCREES